MEIYDYTSNSTKEVSSIIDSLKPNEIEKVNKAILAIQQSEKHDRQEKSLMWFNSAIVPLLQDFSDLTASVLEIDHDDVDTINVTITSDYGYDITESCKYMKLVFELASHIGINIERGKLILFFAFEYSDFLG